MLNLSSQKQTFLFGSIPQTAFILPFFLSRIFVPLFFYIVDIQLQNSSHMDFVQEIIPKTVFLFLPIPDHILQSVLCIVKTLLDARVAFFTKVRQILYRCGRQLSCSIRQMTGYPYPLSLDTFRGKTYPHKTAPQHQTASGQCHSRCLS